MSGIRPCRLEDLSSVADLFCCTFRQTQPPAPKALVDCLRDVYFRHPWQDERCRSLVYEAKDGEVAGFIGSLPTWLRLDGQRLLAAVAGNFMVRRELGDPMVGPRLIRSLLQNGQDITISDSAGDTSLRMFELAGASQCFSRSLRWFRPLRPVRWTLQMLARKRASPRPWRMLHYPALAVDRVAAGLWRRLVPIVPPGYHDTELPLPELLDALATQNRQYALSPDYDLPGLQWLIAQAGEKRQYGPLRQRAVRDGNGQLRGWFMYYYDQQGGLARVLQWGAIGRTYDLVIKSLLHDAWQRGASGVEAQVLPGSAAALREHDAAIVYSTPYFVAHTTRCDLAMRALQRDDAFLSRLEGEWWMRLMGDAFPADKPARGVAETQEEPRGSLR